MASPFQELQRGASFLAEHPEGKAINNHLLC